MIVLESPTKAMTRQMDNCSLEDTCDENTELRSTSDYLVNRPAQTQTAKTISPVKRNRPTTRGRAMASKDNPVVVKNASKTKQKMGLEKTGNSSIEDWTSKKVVEISPHKKTKEELFDEGNSASDETAKSAITRCLNFEGQHLGDSMTKEHPRQEKQTLFDTTESLKCANLEAEKEKIPHVGNIEGAGNDSSSTSSKGVSQSIVLNDAEKEEAKIHSAIKLHDKLGEKLKVPKTRRSQSVDCDIGNKNKVAQSVGDKSANKVSSTKSNENSRTRKVKRATSQEDLLVSNSRVTDFYQYRRSDRRLGVKMPTKEEVYEKLVKEKCQDGLKVVEFEHKGRGIVATKEFERNDFIVEYRGDLITPQEAKEREVQFENNPDVGCYMYYFVHGGNRYCIDATKELDSFGYGRLLNHSRKNANCRTKSISVYGEPKLILIANRQIKIGEELLYDYGDRSKTALANHPWLAQ